MTFSLVAADYNSSGEDDDLKVESNEPVAQNESEREIESSSESETDSESSDSCSDDSSSTSDDDSDSSDAENTPLFGSLLSTNRKRALEDPKESKVKKLLTNEQASFDTSPTDNSADNSTAVPFNPSLCHVCQELPFKYTCPGCFVKSCSLACIKLHKSIPSIETILHNDENNNPDDPDGDDEADTGGVRTILVCCDGKPVAQTPAVKFVPLNQYDQECMMKDLGFLERGRKLSEPPSSKTLASAATNVGLGAGKVRAALGKRRHLLASRVKKFSDGGLELTFLSPGMQRNVINQSFFHCKLDVIFWTLELLIPSDHYNAGGGVQRIFIHGVRDDWSLDCLREKLGLLFSSPSHLVNNEADSDKSNNKSINNKIGSTTLRLDGTCDQDTIVNWVNAFVNFNQVEFEISISNNAKIPFCNPNDTIESLLRDAVSKCSTPCTSTAARILEFPTLICKLA